MKKILFAIALLGMAVSCTVNEVEFSKSGKSVIKATTDAETRMTIQPVGDGTFCHLWEDGDAVAVYDGYNSTKYELSEGAGTTKGDFTGDELTTGQLLYPVFYPYSDDLDIYTIDGKNLFGYTFPSVVEKSVENYEQNVMIGMLDNGTVQMKNCAAYIKLSFSTDVLSFVNSIKITALNGESICGKFLFGYDGATGLPFAVPDESSKGGNTVTLNFPGGEMLTANTRSFYVALPPVGMIEKLAFTFYGDFNGEPELEYISSKVDLERNVVIDFDEISTIYNVEPDAVAFIGENGYKTLAEAFAAASESAEDATIKMVYNVYLAEGVTLDNVNDKVITLDLNGCKITASTDFNYAITTKSDLVVTDSKRTGAIRAKHSALRANTGKLTIEGGTFEGDGYISDGCGVIYSYGTGSRLTVNGGTIKCNCGEDAGRAINVTQDSFINGGTIICDGPGFTVRQYTAGNCTIDGEKVVIYSNSTAQSLLYSAATACNFIVKNGYFFADSEKDIVSNASRFQISGGHFNKAVPAADGFKCVESAVTGPDGRAYTHGIAESYTVDVTIGGNTTSYKFLADGLEAALAASEARITLLNDCSFAGEVVATNKLTIDLNGMTLTTAASKNLKVNGTGADVKILDSSAEGTGTYNFIATGGYVGLDVISGNLTLESGTIKSTARGANVRIGAGCTFTMNGGRILNIATSTVDYTPYALSLKGTATINGGVLSCDLSHTVYIATNPVTLNINGGAFVAKTAGKYPLYATTSGQAHVITIGNSVSEPLFVGAGSGDNAGRVFYNGYTVSKFYTKAGYFTDPYLGKPSSPNTYVASGYKRVTGLSHKETIEGVEYTFTMQVVKN